MINYTHPARPTRNAPSVADLTAERLSEVRESGFAVADRATEALFASLPYEAPELPRHTLTRRGRYVLLMLAMMCAAALSLAGVTPTASAATPVSCASEDAPGWSWSKCGNRERGVILKSAPKACKWVSARRACFTVMGTCEYRQARIAKTIDLKRTRALKGDAWARDHGCTV